MGALNGISTKTIDRLSSETIACLGFSDGLLGDLLHQWFLVLVGLH